MNLNCDYEKQIEWCFLLDFFHLKKEKEKSTLKGTGY